MHAQNQSDAVNFEQFVLESTILNDSRNINVWLPSEYKGGKKRYTVLFIPSGEESSNFMTFTSTIARLIDENAISPMIVVGIESVSNDANLKLADFSQAESNSDFEKYLTFIKKELEPKINKSYRTNTLTAVIGESVAGLFVLETYLLKPETFDYYIAFDPAIWMNDYQYVKDLDKYLVDLEYPGKTLWFAGSSSPDVSKSTRIIAKTLKKRNVVNLSWYYADEVGEKHETIFRNTKEKALTQVFGG
ncbi:MAG: alpha/beta hydrolase-fold protein [Crocinitomicaceae bacterium]|nr:alpha/beta hydrolase-fold protein [Crocinitomicaceae bacterium]